MNGKGYMVDDDILAAAELDAQSVAIGGSRESQINSLDIPLYHRRDYAAAGQVSLAFFDEGGNEDNTNLTQQGQIPSQSVFALWGFGVNIITALARDGTVTATGSQGDATAVAPVTIAEQVRRILHNGKIEVRANGKPLFTLKDLTKLPSGCGVDVSVSLATTASGAAFINNGVPMAANIRRLGRRPHILPGGMQFSAKVSWPAALALTGGGVLELIAYGTQYFK